jgi:hypothetical protein
MPVSLASAKATPSSQLVALATLVRAVGLPPFSAPVENCPAAQLFFGADFLLSPLLLSSQT